MSDKQQIVLCAANAYEEKFYFNEIFEEIPDTVKQELQIMCVLYTAEIGGILTMQFNEEGQLLFHVTSEEGDLLFDEIGSVLKIKQYQREKEELLESLELYYKVKFLEEKY